MQASRYIFSKRASVQKAKADEYEELLGYQMGNCGGCPDVPYLAREMIGKSLLEAPKPQDIGHTLCGYALHLAYEEMVRRCWQ